jgi:hypothetical protein
MDSKRLTDLASTLTASCKDAVRKSKVTLYTSPVILTTLVVIQMIAPSPDKRTGWFDIT